MTLTYHLRKQEINTGRPFRVRALAARVDQAGKIPSKVGKSVTTETTWMQLLKTKDLGNTKPAMLILSFSEIVNDARVLKQVNLFKDDWAITTCGYGPAPEGVVDHLQVPENQATLDLDGRPITLKQYRLAYSLLPAVRATRSLLRGRRKDYQVVLANEPEAVPLASKLDPAWGVHADLHEYTPSLHEYDPAWDKRIKPYFEWLVRKYAAKADSWTSPSEGVGRKYFEKFGFRPVTVTNAAPATDLYPTKVKSPIRFVHHGGAQRNRNPQVMMQGFMESTVNGTFDLFLTGINPETSEALRRQSAKDPRVTVHEGIPYRELLKTLNDFDVGVFLLPPITHNYKWALPNKLFDNVQARLGQIVSPNPEMAKVVARHSLGVVTDGYEAADLTRVLDVLTEEDVAAWKLSAHENALRLSAESEVPKWRSAIEALKHRGTAD